MSDVPPVPRATPTAKEVAKALDHRQRRRKLLLLALLGASIALAIVYGTCGHGWGLGAGGGKGEGENTAATVDATPRRCAIQVAREGITVDGAKATRDEVVAACKKAGGGADVVVTGDAREGDWKDLEAALAAAKIKPYVRK